MRKQKFVKQLKPEILEALNKVSKKQWVVNTKGEPKDGSARFKLIGGPYHGNLVRLYGPWDDLTFPDGSCYTLTAPLGRDDQWVYVHQPKPKDEEYLCEADGFFA